MGKKKGGKDKKGGGGGGDFDFPRESVEMPPALEGESLARIAALQPAVPTPHPIFGEADNARVGAVNILTGDVVGMEGAEAAGETPAEGCTLAHLPLWKDDASALEGIDFDGAGEDDSSDNVSVVSLQNDSVNMPAALTEITTTWMRAKDLGMVHVCAPVSAPVVAEGEEPDENAPAPGMARLPSFLPSFIPSLHPSIHIHTHTKSLHYRQNMLCVRSIRREIRKTRPSRRKLSRACFAL